MDPPSPHQQPITNSLHSGRPRSGSSSDIQRFDDTLSFVAGNTDRGEMGMSAVDSDVYSWLLMNSDLFLRMYSNAI